MAIKIQHDKQGNIIGIDTNTKKVIGTVTSIEKDMNKVDKSKTQ